MTATYAQEWSGPWRRGGGRRGNRGMDRATMAGPRDRHGRHDHHDRHGGRHEDWGGVPPVPPMAGFGPGGPGGPGMGGPGFGDFSPPGFGPRGPRGGRGGRFRRGPRVRRGDVRAAILALLAEEPRNGYQIIQEIGERSGGIWRPSPGSVYPALSQLEDEGLVAAEHAAGRKAFALTEEGRRYVTEHADEVRAPWDTVSGSVGDGVLDLRDVLSQVAAAAMQVAHAGTGAQLAEAQKVLGATRRDLYRILAEDPADADDEVTDETER